MLGLLGSDPFTTVSFVLGFVAVAYYFMACVRSSKRDANFLEGCGFLAGGVGIATAVRICYLAIASPDEELAPFTDEDRIVIVLGALALFWMFYLLVKNFRKSL